MGAHVTGVLPASPKAQDGVMVAYATMSGGESCVYLPIRCCQLYFINEAIGVGEGRRECQSHKLRTRDVLGRSRDM